MSLLVVGSVAYDGIETPFGKVDKVPGGSATYASLSASYFYNPVRLVGVVGKDFAQSDIDAFKNRKVDTEGLQIDQSGNTFFWQGRYHENFQQRDTLDTQLNVFANFDPILPEQYKESEYICLANIQPDLQQKVLDQVENPKMIIMDTMNLWIDNALDDLKKMKSDLQDKINIREQGENPDAHVQIKVAMATCGIASGAKEVYEFFQDELEKRNIEAVVLQTGCMGYCYAEPTIEVILPGEEPVVFGYVDTQKAGEIINKYIKSGELVDGVIPDTYKTIDNK